MPEGTKVARCVHEVMAKSNLSKVSAIRICQKSTGMSYQTGKPSKARARLKNKLRKNKNG